MRSQEPLRYRARSFATLWLAAFVAAALIGTHGVAYWDAGDYVRLALTGGESGLLLGRPLFLFVSRAVLALGIEPAHAEAVLRWFWTAVGATAAPLLAMLAERLGADRRLSFVAGLFLALSPSFAHTTHQVLTDSTALALSIAALCLAARGQAAAAGLILAAAIATRETATIHLIAAAWLCGRRAWSVIAVCAVSVAAIVAISTPPSLNAWFSAMSSSVTTHPLALMDIGLACVWVLAAGPVPVVLGAIVLARRRASPPVYKVALPALMATAALLFYPDGSFSPRYMLAAVPLAFFIPAAIALTPHRTWLVVSLALPLLVAMFGAQQAKRVAAYGATLDVRISALPQGAVVVPGHFCPQARLAATVHDRSDLTFICPGWEWPADIDRVLDQALAGSSTVAIDASSEAWVGTRELPLRERVHAWLARHATRELAGFTVIGG